MVAATRKQDAAIFASDEASARTDYYAGTTVTSLGGVAHQEKSELRGTTGPLLDRNEKPVARPLLPSGRPSLTGMLVSYARGGE